MKIEVTYYALFREAAGCSGELIETDSSDAIALFELLAQKYGFRLGRAQVRLAVNDAFVDWNTPLTDGDSIVFIPPVAGG